MTSLVTWEPTENVLHEYSEDGFLTIMLDQSVDDDWFAVQTYVKDDTATHGWELINDNYTSDKDDAEYNYKLHMDLYYQKEWTP
jgi:hypothetical protein